MLDLLTIDKTRGQLERHEGFREKPYLDTVGVTTFGHGLTFITEDESRSILAGRVTKLDSILCLFPWYLSMNLARRAVIINMAYNMGIHGVQKFVNMIAAIQSGDFKEAAEEMLNSKWSRQVHGRAIELAEQMKSGEWRKCKN